MHTLQIRRKHCLDYCDTFFKSRCLWLSHQANGSVTFCIFPSSCSIANERLFLCQTKAVQNLTLSKNVSQKISSKISLTLYIQALDASYFSFRPKCLMFPTLFIVMHNFLLSRQMLLVKASPIILLKTRVSRHIYFKDRNGSTH